MSDFYVLGGTLTRDAPSYEAAGRWGSFLDPQQRPVLLCADIAPDGQVLVDGANRSALARGWHESCGDRSHGTRPKPHGRAVVHGLAGPHGIATGSGRRAGRFLGRESRSGSTAALDESDSSSCAGEGHGAA